MSERELFQKLIRQNEIIISLIGKMVFSPKEIRETITKGKRKENRINYVSGYNACDGNHTVLELAEIADLLFLPHS